MRKCRVPTELPAVFVVGNGKLMKHDLLLLVVEGAEEEESGRGRDLEICFSVG